jgi:hypothetical protein
MTTSPRQDRIYSRDTVNWSLDLPQTSDQVIKPEFLLTQHDKANIKYVRIVLDNNDKSIFKNQESVTNLNIINRLHETRISHQKG